MDTEKSHRVKWWRRAQKEVNALPDLVRDEIWRPGHLEDQSNRAKFFGLLRIIALTVDGVRTNRIPSQAAALSYYTLIALGPLIAIAIMVSGFIMPEDGRDRIADKLTEAVYFVVPSAAEANQIEVHPTPPDDGAAPSATPAKDNPEKEAKDEMVVEDELEEAIDLLVANSRSSTIGIVGSIMLIIISIQLLSTIEKTYNTIWGVQQGRNFFSHVVFYWTIISLGAVLGVTLVTLGYGKIASAFEGIPFGGFFRDSMLSLAPLVIFIATVLLLALFNRFIPNARVQWRPAFMGALVVALLLYAN